MPSLGHLNGIVVHKLSWDHPERDITTKRATLRLRSFMSLRFTCRTDTAKRARAAGGMHCMRRLGSLRCSWAAAARKGEPRRWLGRFGYPTACRSVPLRFGKRSSLLRRRPIGKVLMENLFTYRRSGRTFWLDINNQTPAVEHFEMSCDTRHLAYQNFGLLPLCPGKSIPIH